MPPISATHRLDNAPTVPPVSRRSRACVAARFAPAADAIHRHRQNLRRNPRQPVRRCRRRRSQPSLDAPLFQQADESVQILEVKLPLPAFQHVPNKFPDPGKRNPQLPSPIRVPCPFVPRVMLKTNLNAKTGWKVHNIYMTRF